MPRYTVLIVEPDDTRYGPLADVVRRLLGQPPLRAKSADDVRAWLEPQPAFDGLLLRFDDDRLDARALMEAIYEGPGLPVAVMGAQRTPAHSLFALRHGGVDWLDTLSRESVKGSLLRLIRASRWRRRALARTGQLDELRRWIEDIIARIDAGEVGVPSFPRAVLAYQEAYRENRAMDARTAVHLLEQDPALAARVLNLSNRATYAGRARARTLAGAVKRLGNSAIYNLVIAHAIETLFSFPEGDFRRIFGRMWGTHFKLSSLARELTRARAERAGLGAEQAWNAGEESCLHGLLHKVGELFLLKQYAEAEPAAGWDMGEVLEIIAEQQIHVGPEMLRRWGFEAPFFRLASHQYDPEALADAEEKARAIELHLSGRLIAGVGLSYLHRLPPGLTVGRCFDLLGVPLGASGGEATEGAPSSRTGWHARARELAMEAFELMDPRRGDRSSAASRRARRTS